MEDEQAEKRRDYEAWNLNKDDGTKVGMPQREREVKEEEENIDELIDMQYARPPKEDWDCESICSTYTNKVNHPRVIAYSEEWGSDV